MHEYKPIYTSMKKLYLFLITALVAMCGSIAAKAATGGTISWNYPGAVEIYTWDSTNKTLIDCNVADDATSYTVTTNMKAHYVYINEGYEVASFAGVKPNGQSQTINKGNPWGYEGEKTDKLYNVTFNGSNAGTNFILTLVSEEEANKEATFTLDIENGADLISGITVGSRSISYADGKQSVSYKPAIEKGLNITVMGGKSLYSVTHNGTALSELNNYGTKYYKIDEINPEDIVTVRGYEEDPDIEICKVSIDISEAAKGAIKKLWNSTLLKDITPAEDGSYSVNKGTLIKILFNEDYSVNSVKANDTDISVNELSTGNITIENDTHIVIDAAPIEYTDVTWTVYIANPEGVRLHAGNGTEGYDLDLGNGGEPTTTEIQFNAAYENGTLISPAMNIPAGQAYKYTFSVSSKYSTLMYTSTGDYWIKGARLSNLSTSAGNPVSDHTFYIAAQKINRTAKAAVYLSTNGVKAILQGNSKNMAPNITIEEQGYNIIEFDPEFDAPFSARFYSSVEQAAVYVDGTAMKADDNGIYTADIKDGSVIKMFGDGKSHSESTISITADRWASAEITYDKFIKTNEEFKCFDGTEVIIVPGPYTTITVDGGSVPASLISKAAAADGASHTFTTTGAHQISLTYDGPAYDEYVLDPVSGATVESIDPITIAFPNATDVTVEMAEDEILLMAQDQSWAATAISVSKVEDAPCPTFKFAATPTPTALKTYVFDIPEGFFKIHGESSPAIGATFTLKKDLSDIEVMFSPTGEMPVEEYPSFNIVFNDNINVTVASDITDKMKVTFDGEVLTPETDFIYGSEAFFFMIMLNNPDYFKPGKLTVALEAGALDLSGTPSPAIEHTWTLIEPKDYTYTITPDESETVTTLGKITIVFENAETAEIDNTYGINLKGGTPGNADYYNVTGKIAAVEGEEHPSFDITFDPAPSTPGKYTFTIGISTFFLDNTTSFPSSYLTHTYTLSTPTGIEGVIADGEANDYIYNLQGVKLDSKWNELPAGLYIVGGKKVMKH